MPSKCICAQLARLQVTARPISSSGTSSSSSLNRHAYALRSFSSTGANLNVPPESPRWIQVPTPPQSQASEQKREPVKGTLPVPRDVFPNKEKDRKIQPEYLQQTAPKPTSEASMKPVPPGSRSEYRRRMAESRRENLAKAIHGLYERKQAIVTRAQKASRERLRRNQIAVKAAEAEDDRLTRSSVLSSLAKTTRVTLDPLRHSRAQRSKEKTKRLIQQKSEERQHALMELYMNSAKFIVSEEELTKECDRLFAPNYWRTQGNLAHDSQNAWGVWEEPPTVLSMLDEMLRRQQRAIDLQQSEHDRTVQRQKIIAEELTGGKM